MLQLGLNVCSQDATSPHPVNRPLSYAEFNEHCSYDRFPEKIGSTVKTDITRNTKTSAFCALGVAASEFLPAVLPPDQLARKKSPEKKDIRAGASA